MFYLISLYCIKMYDVMLYFHAMLNYYISDYIKSNDMYCAILYHNISIVHHPLM